jgi:pSer/pThr/pTyr-binding forkhead associated (FHA) protein
MSDEGPSGVPPFDRYSSTPQELKDRLAAERSGDPHLIYRDGDGRQVIRTLPANGPRVMIGRREESDVSLPWDGEVSRVHAELQVVGRDWTVVDDGLSRNGSFVNSERLQGRRRLRDGDTLLVGRTMIVVRIPRRTPDLTTRAGTTATIRDTVGDADRRVLVALCRPLRDPVHTLPATNQAIADELCVSVHAVKKRLGALFRRFEIDDLPQSEKRARLAILALHRGVVNPRDL